MKEGVEEEKVGIVGCEGGSGRGQGMLYGICERGSGRSEDILCGYIAIM